MKIDRLVSMIMILLDKKRIGAQELADMYEVSVRTIYRDIDSINMAGIPVRATPGVGGGFEIMPDYKLDKNVFSTTELSSILMGLSSLSNIVRGDELINALAKVRSFLPPDHAKDIELKSNQICIDLSPWIGNQNTQPYLEKIRTALDENRLISFSYTDGHSHRTTRTAEPYQLVLKSSHWYVQSYCRIRKAFRLFRLSRMTELQLEAETFTPREYKKPQLDFADILSKMQTIIKLRIHNSILDRVLDYCTFEQLSPDDEEHSIVSFPFIENDFYYDILLSFGDKCKCLEPPHVRAELMRRIGRIASIYQAT